MDLHDPDECENFAFKSCYESGIPGAQQVWSLTPLYSVDFSQSRIGVTKVRFQQTHNLGLHQLFWTVFWELLAYRGTPYSVFVSL